MKGCSASRDGRYVIPLLHGFPPPPTANTSLAGNKSRSPRVRWRCSCIRCQLHSLRTALGCAAEPAARPTVADRREEVCDHRPCGSCRVLVNGQRVQSYRRACRRRARTGRSSPGRCQLGRLPLCARAAGPAAAGLHAGGSAQHNVLDPHQREAAACGAAGRHPPPVLRRHSKSCRLQRDCACWRATRPLPTYLVGLLPQRMRRQPVDPVKPLLHLVV